MAPLLGLISLFLVGFVVANAVSSLDDFDSETLSDDKTITKTGRSECTEPSSERTKMHCGDEIDKKMWVISKDKEGCAAIYVDCNVFDGDLFETRSECISTCFPDANDFETIHPRMYPTFMRKD